MPEKLRVLCVDDNPDAIQSVGELLRLAGCEVLECPDGATALASAVEFSPDVCVLDLTMPGMGGEELATKLREQAGERPMVGKLQETSFQTPFRPPPASKQR